MQQHDTIDIFLSLENHRVKGEVLVFTNGCFDVLHTGHLRYLEAAKKLGRVLVIGLNSDDSVKRLKGRGRPIVPQDERAELLLGLRAVDYVCIFEEETPLELIRRIRPDVLVKGGDWPLDKIVGADFVQSYGGSVQSIAFVAGKSSTGIIEKIQQYASSCPEAPLLADLERTGLFEKKG